VSDIAMRPCKSSSQVAEYGYDPAARTLAVRYKNGGLYHYEDVPQKEFDGLCKAQSAGSFLHANVKSKYKHKLIPEKKHGVGK
jgi:hypothetical protein